MHPYLATISDFTFFNRVQCQGYSNNSKPLGRESSSEHRWISLLLKISHTTVYCQRNLVAQGPSVALVVMLPISIQRNRFTLTRKGTIDIIGQLYHEIIRISLRLHWKVNSYSFSLLAYCLLRNLMCQKTSPYTIPDVI